MTARRSRLSRPRQGMTANWTARAWRVLLPCALMLVLAAGCSGKKSNAWTKARPQTFPVKGVVTFDGAAVEGATVVFLAEGKNLAATGVTGADGRYVLRTFEPQDGAVAGRHAVRITKTTEIVERPSDPEAPLPPPKITQHLPAKYTDQTKSGLSAEVSEKGSNEFSFALVK